jgi:histidine ammonia-lyase
VIELGARPLGLADVEAVARRATPVRTGRGVEEALRASRAVVERALAERRVVYGVTTGFGELKDKHISPEQVAALQLNLLRSHALGVGEPVAADVSRAMLLLRAASLAHGNSGVRPVVVERLLDLLRTGVTPIVPSQGSVGASGDLAPLAHLALVLVGEGEAWLDGTRMSGADALRRARLEPVRLEAKEGLALVNGTQLSTAFAVLATVDAGRLWSAALAAGTLGVEVLFGSFQPARDDIQRLRPYAGAVEAARRMRAQSEGSGLVASHRDCGRVQDAYSLRCMPQVMGAARDALGHVEAQLAIEVNSVNDNPVVLPAAGDVVSAGLFHAHPVALASDYLKLAVQSVATMSERRIDRLLDARVSDLPAVLADQPGVESGLMLAQYTAAALVSENKTLCHPASVDSIPTGAGLEDHVSMAPIAARHAARVVQNTARVVALEWLCAARALELRRPLTAGAGSERLHRAVRARVPAPRGDASLSAACEELAGWVLSGEVDQLLEESLT